MWPEEIFEETFQVSEAVGVEHVHQVEVVDLELDGEGGLGVVGGDVQVEAEEAGLVGSFVEGDDVQVQ